MQVEFQVAHHRMHLFDRRRILYRIVILAIDMKKSLAAAHEEAAYRN